MLNFLHRTLTTRTTNIISIILCLYIAFNLVFYYTFFAKDWSATLAKMVNVSNFLIFVGSFILLIYFTIYLKSKIK